ncbi:MAG: PKD domain-containing protein [Bacteroidota bacterium]
MFNLRSILFVVFSFFFIQNSFSQKEANNWYFGSYAAIDFNSGTPVGLTTSQMSTLEGCASISSASGSLLFYTDGITVWDKTHQIMPNGTGLKGHFNASQSAVVIPKPGSSTIYIIFTVDQIGNANGVMYSELDISLNSGKGDIISSRKNIALVAPASEKITAVQHSNENDFWMLCHKYGSDEIYAYLITSSGVSTTPVISKTGITIPTDNSANTLGYMKASANGNKIAYANGGNLKNVCLADLDATTGKVSNVITYSITNASPYGVEFSPNGDLLYVTYSNKTVRQYDANATSTSEILTSEQIIATDVVALGALQLGPDKKMYIASFSQFLSVIHLPDIKGSACNYEKKFVDLKGNSCSYGLPSFIQSYFSRKTFTVSNNCLNDTTFFTLSSDKDLDSVRWLFDDPGSGQLNTSTSTTNVFHIYRTTGKYTVKLIAHFRNGKSDTTTAGFIIKYIKPNIGKDTSFCGNFSLTLSPERDYLNYLWSTQSTSKTIQATTKGTYILNVTDTNGCTAADTILINNTNSPTTFTVNLDSQCYHQQNFIFYNTSDTIKNSYKWVIDGKSYTNNILTKKDFKDSTYEIFLISTGGCSDTMKKTIIVWPSPVPDFIGDTGCFPFPIQYKNTSTIRKGSIAKYYWSFMSYGNSDVEQPLKTYPVSGYFSTELTAISDKGCTTYKKKDSTALLYPQPKASFTYDTLPSPDPREKILQFINTSSSDVTSYWWNLGNGQTSTIKDPSGKYKDSITYTITLKVSNANGCIDSTSTMVYPNFYLYLPNVFTPGNDLLNDIYKPATIDYVQSYLMQVYNRWGELVFETKNVRGGWDGQLNGQACPEGIYLCVIKAMPYGGSMRIYKTTVTLLR